MEKSKEDMRYARSLIEASLDPLVTISPEGKITDVNEASVKVTGVMRDKLIDTDFSNYFTDPVKARAGYLQVFEKGFVSDYALTIKHQNGKLTDVLYNASLYKDINGLVLGVFAAARDVTEQKWAIDLRIANKELAFQNNEKEKRANELVLANEELAYQNQEKERRSAELGIANKELAYQNIEKEKRANELSIANKELAYQNNEKEKRASELALANKELELQNDEKEIRVAELRIAKYSRSLIEASRDPLVTISIEGRITDMNEAMLKVTGKTRDELKGTHFKIYFTEPEKASLVYKEIFEKGYVSDYPLTIIDHKFTEVLFNGSVYKDEEGNILGAVIVARDITEQKRTEKELTEAIVFAELATEMAEVAKLKAEEATHIAKDAVRSKQQFLSNMSHEIRTPMNAIIGFTKVVLKTNLSFKQKEYLNAIKMSGDALIVLINDILDLAKVDAGKMTFEKTPFKLALSISSMMHLFEAKIQEKNLQFIKEYDPEIPSVLLGDSVRLHQIILNLLSNAVKFTNQGSITLSVKLLKETDQNVTIEFSVLDTGIGISSNKLGNIFENFQQATSSTSRLFGGTGLGLAIVKQLVESQGGTIKVSSEILMGSNFSFCLNFDKTTQPSEVESSNVELKHELKNIKVLVVEDIPLNQLLMKTLLDDFGFERDIASNGKIAIEKLQQKNYDIILMDLQMPEMNGFEATEYIRNKIKSKIPIIALTADVTTVDLGKCKSVGMNDYIAKPIDERLLYNKIINLVKKPNIITQTKIEVNGGNNEQGMKSKKTDLSYLNKRTKSNPALMLEMIELYLEQTPPLILTMKQSLVDKDWNTLNAAVHKIIPSFSIMGMSKDLEEKARKVQEYANKMEQLDDIANLVTHIEEACIEACKELKEEYNQIKTSTK